MWKHTRLLALVGIICAALAVPLLVFFNRSPVLVVTDASFVALYGEERVRQRQFAASLALFRQVKPVVVADGASPDILMFSITEATARPFCVLFPRTQAQAAERYHENFPQIPVALLNGMAPALGSPAPDGILCVYGANREIDLYRAGLFAGILGPASQGMAKEEEPEQQEPARKTYVLMQDIFMQAAERDVFSGGVKEGDEEAVISFIGSAAAMPDIRGLACVVLTGTKSEFFEKSLRIPIILFSWMHPEFTAKEVVVLFDDSPWALAAELAQMAVSGQAEGNIPSKPLILSERIADKSISRILEKSAKKVPGQAAD